MSKRRKAPEPSEISTDSLDASDCTESLRTADLPAERPVPPPWRWPAGTHIEKDWDGDGWVVSASVPGCTEILFAHGTSSFKAESFLAVLYQQWLAKQGKE